ncbi:MAG: SDR family NAD(P)-dependent oxidoreductase, partial [Mangrovicoccus sp.]
MRNALIIGASGGIGRAVYQRLATSLGAENVTALTRTETGFDLRDPGSISDSLGQLTGSYDLIFLACGILAPQGGKPEKSIKNIDFSSMTELMEVNAIGPALVLKEAERLIPRGRRSVIAALSARVGSIGDNRLGGWYSYRASKAALNQVIRCAAIEFSRNRPQ